MVIVNGEILKMILDFSPDDQKGFKELIIQNRDFSIGNLPEHLHKWCKLKEPNDLMYKFNQYFENRTDHRTGEG